MWNPAADMGSRRYHVDDVQPERLRTPEVESIEKDGDQYLLLPFGITFVTIRAKDFWINATYILRVAGKHRNILTGFRNSGAPFIIVRGSHDYQGTYVDF